MLNSLKKGKRLKKARKNLPVNVDLPIFALENSKISTQTMTYINLPTDEVRPLSFYLAEEEYLARTSPKGDLFFMWQVNPSVIFGRNQDVETEVNTDYCRSHGISMFRRKSGGGCVYADMSNVMLSYITPSDEVMTTFERYLEMVVDVLGRMGVKATWTQNNDIMIGDRKVSGNAFYHIPGYSIVHGTLLYDTNMQNMVASITPPVEKLVRHGVESVRQRIALLKDYTKMSLEEVKRFIKVELCDGQATLTPHDIGRIEQLEREYDDPKWIFRKITH